MASLGRKLAISILSEVAKSTGLPKAGELVKLAFSKITGQPVAPSDQQKLETQLRDVKAGLENINDAIRTLSSKIDDEFFQIKIDSLAQYTTKIESMYDTYTKAILIYTSGKKESKPGSNRATLTRLGKEVADKIHEQLNSISNALAGKKNSMGSNDNAPLIIKACDASRSKSKDVVTFYVYMKSFLVNYVKFQAQGIYLMAAANADPSVDTFSIGDAQIQDVYANLEWQQQVLELGMGKRLYNFVTRMLDAPRDHQEVDITLSGEGQSLQLTRKRDDDAYLTPSGEYSEWRVESVQDLTIVDTKTEYWFKLKCLRSELYLGHNPKKPRLVARDPTEQGWLILPAESDKFRLQYKPKSEFAAWDRNGQYAYRHGGPNGHWDLKAGIDQTALFIIEPSDDWGLGTGMQSQSGREDFIRPGKWLHSPEGRYRFLLQKDTGYLQIIDTKLENKVIWQVNKPKANGYGNVSPGKVILEHNGDLVARNGKNKPYWDMGHSRREGNSMRLTNEGKIEIWNRGTVKLGSVP